jgi:hypothetical protein
MRVIQLQLSTILPGYSVNNLPGLNRAPPPPGPLPRFAEGGGEVSPRSRAAFPLELGWTSLGEAGGGPNDDRPRCHQRGRP